MFNLFDFNHDGEVTAAEFALGLSIMEEIEAEEYDLNDEFGYLCIN